MAQSATAPTSTAQSQADTSASVEMDNLAAAGLTGATPSLDPAPQAQERVASAGAQQTDGTAETAATTTTTAAASAQPAEDSPTELRQTATATSTAQRDPLVRKETEALGPATDAPISPPTNTGPALSITLMLITGARHPYKIDEKYLRNRKVDPSTLQATDGKFEPLQLSGYKLKELIWTDWRSEWEPRPASPSSIRLILLGRLIEDKTPLKGESVDMWSRLQFRD